MSENKTTPSENTEVPQDKIRSIGDEEAITEIDFGSFLADHESGSSVYDGFHEDIANTEKSLEDELQNLYSDIMSSGPATIVPKKLDDITAEKDEPLKDLSDLWMSPEDYIDMPSPDANPTEPEVPNSADTEAAKDSIFNMIEDLKSTTDTDKSFDEILAGIESNSEMSSAESDIEKTAEQLSSAAAVEPEKTPNVISIADLDKALSGLTTKNDESETDSSSENSDPVDFSFETEVLEDDTRAADKPISTGKKKKTDSKDIVRKIVLAVSIITIIVSGGYLINNYVIEPYKFKKNQKEVESIVSVNTDSEDASQVIDDSYRKDYPGVDFPEGMLAKYAQLYAINDDLAGWISIPEFEINLPIAIAENNDYYLHRNIYDKWTQYGVPFFDCRINSLKNLPRNTVVYGHNMHYDDLIFGLLENYRTVDGFQQAPVIECNTIFGDHTWFVYACFITNSKESQDNGYVFSYNFLDVSDEKFEEYIKEIDKRKFYTTGVDINYTDKILTLSTCCYDFDGGRLVVVAREKRAEESASPDTSKVSINQNPKYPQAWYNANNKQNPYADDARW